LQGDFTGLEEARLQVFSGIATRGFATGAAVNGFMAWLITGSRCLSLPLLLYCVITRGYTGEINREREQISSRYRRGIRSLGSEGGR
jgi:hypothetical protein